MPAMKEYLQERETRIRGRRQKRKLARVARVRRQIFRYIFLSALLFLGICGFTRIKWFLNDPETDIVVQGNQVVQVEQVRAVLRPYLNRPLYLLDPKEMENKVKQLADVRYAFVRRYLAPHPHLVVNLMEEFPWATFANDPDTLPSAVISETGRLIPLEQFPAVPQPGLKIFGSSATKMKPADIEAWSNWTNYITAQVGSQVDSVDLRKPADVIVKAGDFCLHIGAADASLTKRLGRLASVVPTVTSLSDNIEYIDLSLESNVPLKVSKLPRKPRVEDASASSLPMAVANKQSL
ncbi:MAG: FtsQ-type POTRA domain-containing protein [Candidatus Obscuribacterales bacterium]|nr:FtsQ-type POTRA domain-containing protein [Candidatus Obscuribacterales bacterium]